MQKIPVDTTVMVDGIANQWPFERIVQRGIVVDNERGYLVRLYTNREILRFLRKDLTVITN